MLETNAVIPQTGDDGIRGGLALFRGDIMIVVETRARSEDDKDDHTR
ncbi:MAG: hypothetical protein HYU36_18400 [Planctomycetes bacterium]|nr:hypothetical protein [Planctomycetota bacterium]